MSWFDIFLLASVAAFTALGAKRKLTGLIVGVGSVLLYRVLISIADQNTTGLIIAIVMAVLAGVLFGMIGRASVLKQRGLELPLTIAGGVGGFLAGLLLVGALITSLPIEKRFDGAIVYPPTSTTVGTLLGPAVNSSQLVKVGRSILLYPLLAEDTTQLPASQRGMYSALHALFVVGQPWERSN
jgi:MFS family permease